MKEPLQNLVIDYYEAINLTSAQMTQLKKQQKGKTPISRRQQFLLAGLVAVAGLIAIFIYVPMPVSSELSFENIADEMASTHNKNKDLEFSTAELAEIQRLMTKLDFTPIATPELNRLEWQLVGSGYGSVRGHIAAQLRFQNLRTNTRYTLNQTLFPAGLPDEIYTGQSSGNVVRIWKEGNLLLAFIGLE